VGFGQAAVDSVFGDDVYDEPSAWRPLTLGTLFSEGWDQAWASPPNGSGGPPRQGWLNTFDGVFYRLFIGTFAYSHDLNGGTGGESYSGTATVYLPLSRRLEVRADLPVLSNADAQGNRAVTQGDMTFWTRFLLSESVDFTQSLNVQFRTPSGQPSHGNGVAAIVP
jgi:hypothetical protein